MNETRTVAESCEFYSKTVVLLYKESYLPRTEPVLVHQERRIVVRAWVRVTKTLLQTP